MNRLEMLGALVSAARAVGADAADAVLVAGTSLSVSRRLGAIEHLERAEGFDLGLRVFVGQRQALVSSTDPDRAGFAALAERAVAMARTVPADRFSGLPDAVPVPARDLDLDDPAEPGAEDLLARAAAAEEAALATPGVTNSNGAEAGFHRSRIAILGSNGFAGEYARTSHSVSVSALAGSGTAMERDYDHSTAVHLADLEDPAALGRRAGERAVRRLNPTRPASRRLTVIYDPRVAGSLLGHLSAALNGAAVARGTSFLRDSMGERILAPGLTLRDDPLRRRGLRSRPFDGEGMPGEGRALVEDGMLRSWVLDWRAARQLGLRSTGHASRSISGPPSPATTNLWLEPGQVSPAALMSDVDEGFYVTEMMGSSVNGVTGDYSRGASGFMIRRGELAEAAAGVTIAGNLKQMFLQMAAADDLRFRRGTDAPTLRVDGMTLAGA